jgi:3',5'-cyclic-AMP phosphodiesterase
MVQVPSLFVAQITDIHLFASDHQQLLGMPTADSFQSLIKQLSSLSPKPDLLMLTGDLSQDGTPESYDRLQTLLAPLGIPTYWLPGNHDAEPEAMERSLTHPLFCAEKCFQKGGWQFILLNSQEPGCVHGYLAQTELNELDQQLQKNSARPTIVALHHPPFQMHSDWLDTSILQNAAAFLEVIDRHSQVQLVVFGHVHQEFQSRRKTVTYLGTPSTCIQFEPGSSNFALDHKEPGFRLLRLGVDGTWETTVKRIAYSHQLDLVTMGY